jgi:Family of unknown function (DUF6508)
MDLTTRERLLRLAKERQALACEMEKEAGATSLRLVEQEDGVLCISTGEPAHALLQRCYDDGWVDQDFNWVTWVQTTEYEDLVNDRAKLHTATPEQLSRLLTALVRQDRFIYGAWAAAIKSGLLMSIVVRAAALHRKPEPAS